MDQVPVLRYKVLVEGRSQRQVVKELRISRLPVKKYLTEAVPMRRETAPRARPVWGPVQARVEALLSESAKWTGGKQQLVGLRAGLEPTGRGLVLRGWEGVGRRNAIRGSSGSGDEGAGVSHSSLRPSAS